MASDMKILFVFNFETGDYSCPWWQEIAVVYGSNEDAKTIEDSFYSYFEPLVKTRITMKSSRTS